MLEFVKSQLALPGPQGTTKLIAETSSEEFENPEERGGLTRYWMSEASGQLREFDAMTTIAAKIASAAIIIAADVFAFFEEFFPPTSGLLDDDNLRKKRPR